MIGSVLDKYEILQKIGEGGMATVYRGRHTTLGRDVAIKVLHPHLSRSERNRRRFAREARAIENLDHDNILKIFDYSGTEAEDCYIVTEFVDGVTLQQLVSDHGRLPSEVVALVGIRLGEALGYAHRLGIIHRDLKPENVMVRRDGEVKLMDFGIARFLDEMNLTVTGALVGSPAYMSPEQAMERVLDLRSDLFSLGTLLFHLITGQLPFAGNNPSIILRNIIEGNRPEVMELAPDISGALADLVEALLQTDPGDRPSDCAAVLARLRLCLDEVHIDPEDPRWSLRSWLVSPGEYEQRLREHLTAVLLEAGKARLSAQDHLGALRLFNRLLSLDEDNAEVLELVQGMHSGVAEPAAPSGSRRWIGGGFGLTAAAALLTWALWPARPVAPPAESPQVSLQPGGEDVALAALDPAALEPDTLDSPQESPVEPTPATVATAPAPPVVEPPTRKAPTANLDRRVALPRPSEVVRPAVADAVQRPGRVSVLIGDYAWADIYVDGERIGRTGEVTEFTVTPGKHLLQLRNDLALPHEEVFEVAAGEKRTIEVEALRPRPAVARLRGGLAPDCRVSLDGSGQGTLASLGGRLLIPEPRQAHDLEVACPGAATPLRVRLDPRDPGDDFAVELP